MPDLQNLNPLGKENKDENFPKKRHLTVLKVLVKCYSELTFLANLGYFCAIIILFYR